MDKKLKDYRLKGNQSAGVSTEKRGSAAEAAPRTAASLQCVDAEERRRRRSMEISHRRIFFVASHRPEGVDRRTVASTRI